MSIFGGTFKPFVIRQLEARQALLADGTDSANRSINVQMYTGARAAWVKMSSFVNYSATPGAAPTDDLARKYVLSAGTLISDPEDNTKFALRAGVGGNYSSYGSPAITSRQLGLRPMPGIESINVKNKGAYGSLREATIKFRCWDKKQLDDLEILYMRTGYPVLLEWGWSMYLDTSSDTDKDYTALSNTGDLKISPDKIRSYISSPIKSFSDPTLNPFDTNKTIEDYYDGIMRLNHKFSGNYDGMVGIIKNFTWELLPDGSFSCTTILISMGDAIDSIKMNRPKRRPGDTSTDTSGYKTEFTQLLDDITRYRDESKNKVLYIPPFIFNNSNLDVFPYSLERFGQVESMPTYPTYIQLSYFIALVNYKFGYLQKGKPMINIEIPSANTPGNRGNGLCLASVDSVTVDPAVCIINNSRAKWITGLDEGFIAHPSIREFLSDKETKEFNTLGQIGNIYLNVQHLADRFNEEINNSTDGEVHVYSYLKTVLNDVAKALGSVNDFDIYVSDSHAVIIDKNYTELSSESRKEKKFLLNFFGTNSIVRSFNIQSKIFQSQASMIAIAAGGRLNLGGVNNSTQYYFNTGLENRLFNDVTLAEESQTNADNEIEAKKDTARSIMELRGYLQDFVKNHIFPFPGEPVASANTILNSALLNVNSDINYRSIIPLNVEITLDGLAGIAIGEVFRLNTDMLPKEYSRKYLGFIVTGLQHNIVKSDWTTTITAYVILLDQDSKSSSDNSLTSSVKNSINGLFGQVAQESAQKYYAYSNKYKELLYFIKAYYEDNLRISVAKTKNNVTSTTGLPGVTTTVNGTLVLGNVAVNTTVDNYVPNLYLESGANIGLDINSVIAQANIALPSVLDQSPSILETLKRNGDGKSIKMSEYIGSFFNQKTFIADIVKSDPNYKAIAEDPNVSALAQHLLQVIDSSFKTKNNLASSVIVIKNCLVDGVTNRVSIIDTANTLKIAYSLALKELPSDYDM